MSATRHPALLPRWTVALAVAAAIGWGGCSVEKNYKVLSFFFDGVPKPASEEGAAEGGAAGPLFGVPGGPVSKHTAYTDRRCADCHGDRARFGFSTEGFTGLNATVCLRCHAAIQDRRYLHGPVAVTACLVCHQPHVSPYPALLVQPSPDLCLTCHGVELKTSTTPGHEDLRRDCLQCHDPHGGASKYFLRPASETLPPAEGAPG